MAMVYPYWTRGWFFGRCGFEGAWLRDPGQYVVGMLGALLGGFIFSLLGITAVSLLGVIICAFVSAVVLLVLIGFVRRKGA